VARLSIEPARKTMGHQVTVRRKPTKTRLFCDLVQRPNPDEGFQAYFACIDDPRLAEMGVEAMARQAAAELHCAAIFIADCEAITGEDHAILWIVTSIAEGPSGLFHWRTGGPRIICDFTTWALLNLKMRVSKMDFFEVFRPDHSAEGFAWSTECNLRDR
jgi:hypothetical protein